MFLRRLLVKGFYYYTCISLSVIFFLFVSTFNQLSDTEWKLDDGAQVGKLLWGALFISQLVGLYISIILKRRFAPWNTVKFSMIATGFLVVFIAPSSFFLALTMLSSLRLH